MSERKPTCKGTNYKRLGAGQSTIHKCRKSTHLDYGDYCEIHGLRNEVFRGRKKLEGRRADFRRQEAKQKELEATIKRVEGCERYNELGGGCLQEHPEGDYYLARDVNQALGEQDE